MKRATLILVALALLVGGMGQGEVKADTILVGFPEFDGPTVTSGFPRPPLTVATENFSIPSGDVITGATLSGVFGQTSHFVGSTAEFDLLINGVQVGSTFDVHPDPFFNVVPFNFTITSPAVLSSLESGSATLSVVQESEFNIRLSASTLTLQASPSVPEPSSLGLIGMASASFAGYFGWRRRKLAVA